MFFSLNVKLNHFRVWKKITLTHSSVREEMWRKILPDGGQMGRWWLKRQSPRRRLEQWGALGGRGRIFSASWQCQSRVRQLLSGNPTRREHRTRCAWLDKTFSVTVLLLSSFVSSVLNTDHLKGYDTRSVMNMCVAVLLSSVSSLVSLYWVLKTQTTTTGY